MPTYELNLVLRAAAKPELKEIVKRAVNSIFDRNGLVRSIENLGTRPTPYKMSAHGKAFYEASFFLVKFDTVTSTIAELQEQYGRDIDIIKQSIFKVKEPETEPCTLDNELQPPAYRDSVKEMIKLGYRERNRYTHKFHYNSGLSYYPFQK